ncbi:MAG: DUF4124 domain-containing protein [Thiohalocapsa sp.]|nr:DUF4124 domain-containing protein [Thiohalocapsa sp.]
MLLLAAPAAAESKIYRCTGADGEIEFRQYACHGRDTSAEMDAHAPAVGWTPPAGDAWLKERLRDEPASKRRAPPKSTKDKYADRCWAKHQQIERINKKLRAGYKPPEGNRLRSRRTEYEAYVKRYCR